MSPFSNMVKFFVTQDGAETDLDLGHMNALCIPQCHVKAIDYWQYYAELFQKERRGDYLGATVQVIPHIPRNKIADFKKWPMAPYCDGRNLGNSGGY